MAVAAMDEMSREEYEADRLHGGDSCATTASFHRKMKLIQRRTYGFSNFENYRLRVITQCG